jgi:hypothetical protein
MSSSVPSQSPRILVMQIIAGSLLTGCISFLVIVLFLVQNNQGKGLGNPQGQIQLLSLLCAIMLLAILPVSFFLPAVILKTGLNRAASQPPDSGVYGPAGPLTDEAYLLNLRMSTMIVRMALFEGVSFFASIAYLIEASPLALAVNAVAILLLALNFPTQGRVSAWLEQQQFALSDLRGQKGTSTRP